MPPALGGDKKETLRAGEEMRSDGVARRAMQSEAGAPPLLTMLPSSFQDAIEAEVAGEPRGLAIR